MIARQPTLDEVETFYNHPDFAFLDDGGEMVFDLFGEFWLVFEENDKLIALYNLKPRTNICMEGHILVFKEFRRDYAVVTMGAALTWFCSLGFHKLVVEIPVALPKVINFVKRFGFVQEGFNVQSIRVDGQYYDRVCLGITADMINANLHKVH